MTRQVYNLEFPAWCREMAIHGYRFVRVREYEERLALLQHTSGSGIEFSVVASPGRHAVASCVENPASEEKSVLPWSDRENRTALDDILLLLSIFSRRDVFAVEDACAGEAEGLWTADPRLHIGGGILRSSMPYREQVAGDGHVYDIGFEEGVGEVYSLIRSASWQRKYGHGYVLFLALHAFKCSLLEAAIAQCWTMWEHLFSLHSRGELPHEEVDRTGGGAKIAFLLDGCDLAEQVSEHGTVERLSQLTDMIVRSGRIPEDGSAQRDALLFLRLTEVLLAKILGLSPPNVLGTQREWERPSGVSRKGKMSVFGVRSGRA